MREEERDFEGEGLVVAPLDNGGGDGELLWNVEGLPKRRCSSRSLSFFASSILNSPVRASVSNFRRCADFKACFASASRVSTVSPARQSVAAVSTTQSLRMPIQPILHSPNHFQCVSISGIFTWRGTCSKSTFNALVNSTASAC